MLAVVLLLDSGAGALVRGSIRIELMRFMPTGPESVPLVLTVRTGSSVPRYFFKKK